MLFAGPGAYEVYNPLCKATGYYIPVTQRFKDTGDDIPGPGFYDVSFIFLLVHNVRSIFQKEKF